jgi:phosphoenolpyruvate synthase/pyruvate phosphate dikinase
MSIFEEWEKDAIITDLFDDESLKISTLHAKYIRKLFQLRLQLKKRIEDKNILEQKLEDYFTGKIDGKDINRPPHQIVETKTSALKRISTDQDYIQINLEIAKLEETVLYVKEIVDSIKQRSFNIRNAIEWRKFTNGNI